MSRVLTLHTPTDKALSKLLRDIEALSTGRITHSAGALTERSNQHTVFVNGRTHEQGEPYTGREAPIEDRIAETLKAVSEYRATIAGPVDLVWRKTPEITTDGDLYVRLCFQPSLVRVAPGIWVEQRLIESHCG